MSSSPPFAVTAPFGVTLFDDVYARSFNYIEITINDLADIIATTTAPAKDSLPLLKLGRFGNIPNPANPKAGCPALRREF